MSLDRDAQALADHAADIAQVLTRCGRLRLLSTLPFGKLAFWRQAVTTLDYDEEPPGWRGWLARRGVLNPGRITQMMKLAPRHDVVLLNGGELVDLLYLALAGCAPWIRTPHVLVDAHWHVDPRPWRAALQRLLFRLGRRLLAEVQPHSHEEVAIYVQHFGIPRQVIRPLPWSTSLNGYGQVLRQQEPGDAVVAGGHSYRDYTTLLAALRDEPLPVRIGLPLVPGTEATVDAARALPNVRVESRWTYPQYWQQVADSRVFVMPISPGLTRCTADQTLLNAMALGAIVVATDSMSSRLYLRDGVNGFLVPEGDPVALRHALVRAWNLAPEERERIRGAAQADALGRFSEVRRLVETLQRACAIGEATQVKQSSGRPAAAGAWRRRWWAIGAATSTATAVAAVLSASN
jgi:glycosyltransferase involved in cell wall biosynthesis